MDILKECYGEKAHERYTHEYVMECTKKYYAHGYKSLSQEDKRVVKSYLGYKFGISIQNW